MMISLTHVAWTGQYTMDIAIPEAMAPCDMCPDPPGSQCHNHHATIQNILQEAQTCLGHACRDSSAQIILQETRRLPISPACLHATASHLLSTSLPPYPSASCTSCLLTTRCSTMPCPAGHLTLTCRKLLCFCCGAFVVDGSVAGFVAGSGLL